MTMNAALGRALLHRTPIRQLQLSSSKSSLRQSRTILRTMASANDADVKLDKSTPDAVWKEMLSAEEYHVIRQKGTERPFSDNYKRFYEEEPTDGVYVCRACNTPLYNADTKFSAGCGWPALYQEIPGAVDRHTDSTMGMTRTEITCKNCGGHLGHEFLNEGFPTPTNSRHCVNYVSIKYVPKK